MGTDVWPIRDSRLAVQGKDVWVFDGNYHDHCFWQVSDSVCTTVLTMTLSKKNKQRFARFFCCDVHNKLENDSETNNKQTNVLDLTMWTLVMRARAHTHTHTHTHTLCVCVCVCVYMCVCMRGRVCVGR